MEIKVQIKNVYGNKTVYPVCERAKTFAKIAGAKTLTHSVLKAIEALGFQIIAVGEYERVA